MKFIIPSLALLAAGCQVGYVVPSDLADGVYTIAHDDAGNTVGEPVFVAPANTTAAARRQDSAKFRRQAMLPNPQVHCQDYGVNPDDFWGAWQCFDNFIGSGYDVWQNHDVMCSYGSALAYMCNYAYGQPARNYEYDESISLESVACGNNAAWVYIPDWGKSYGRDNSGANVCF